MRITALQTQVTDKDRINIFVDDSFYMGANAWVVLKLRLKSGQELTPDLVQQLHYEENLQKAVDRAMNFLSFRPRSRDEVRRYLRKKETPAEIIEPAMEKLDQLDLINDQAFTSFWIDARDRFRPKGAQALKQELRQKGVSRDIVDEMVTDEHDDELALDAGRKKAAILIRQPAINYQTFKLRLGSFLQRRGFSYDVSTRTVRALWDELKDQLTEDDDEQE